MRCATCETPLPPRSDNRFHPFCSQRCKTVDLGRWLGEEYAIPGTSVRGPRGYPFGESDGPQRDFEPWELEAGPDDEEPPA